MSTGKKPQQLQELETISVLAAFLLVLNLFLHLKALAVAALALLLIGLFVRPVASVISRSWLKFAEVLGAFNSKIVLSLAFFLFLTPLALLFRLFTKNPLQLKKEPDAETLFLERNHSYTKSDFEKMW
ncbi:MAG: hypothetical protein A2075_06105 [Geobacteraceae bacterium GWC2_58_44]|nr:MAG: hypothetical protein A2075_06105 [Geobacteraceae bacterium GWC2_58_44]HBG05736.1 hypothetical protein [Geobacter sp.]